MPDRHRRRCVPTLIAAALAALALVPAGCGGPQRLTYPDGSLRAEGALVRGYQDGAWRYYHPDGSLRAEGAWERDAQVGPWRWYFPDGSLEQAGSYAEGLRSGWWVYRHPGGALRARGRYQRDRQEGLWVYHEADGDLRAAGTFAAGARNLWWQLPATGEAGLYWAGQRIGPWQGPAGAVDHGAPAGWHRLARGDSAAGLAFRGPDDQLLATGTFADSGQRYALAEAGGRVVVVAFQGGRPLIAGALAVTDGRPLGTWDYRHAAEGWWRVEHDGADGRELVPVPEPGQAGAAIGADPVSAAGPDDAGLADPAVVAAAFDRHLAQLRAVHAAVRAAAAGAAVEPVAPAPPPAPPVSAVELSPTPVAPGGMPLREQELAELWRQVYLGLAPPPRYSDYRPDRGSARQRTGLIGAPLPQSRFVDGSGAVVDLDELRGDGPLILVIMRGFAGNVCPYCVGQTRALLERLEAIRAAGGSLAICYPGSASSVAQFVEAVGFAGPEAVPVPVLLDVDLAFVRALGIERDLARPTTCILDAAGTVRYAYVGADLADRPALDAVLRAFADLGAAGE